MKKQTKILSILGSFLILSAMPLFSQEALKSFEEEYLDMLSLYGTTSRNFLAYRTLSDSIWQFKDDDTVKSQDENPDPANHPWKNNNLGKKRILWESQNPSDNFFMGGLDQSLSLKIYGPDHYNSINTGAPFGQNDGVLWQGRGYNTSLTGGVRLEGYGFEFTFKPQISFSQNLDYNYLIDSEAFTAETFKDKAKKYGYIYGSSCDAVQRFGDSAFWDFSFGDTEIRWNWHTFTVGFGFQSIWLGPSYVNPILHSNNAAPYPKIDIGLRKTEVIIPKLNWNLGFIEGRIWTGYLTESDWFDNNPDNDHNLIHGLTMSCAPSFMPGFTISANRTCLVKASWKNMGYVIPVYDNTYVGTYDGQGEDQKMSFSADWLFQKVGFEIYGEIGVDDFLPAGDSYLQRYLRWPFHATAYTVGARKAFNFKNHPDIKAELIFEWNDSEPSQDYQMWGFYNFGFHGQITQGYTNRGQWLGSGYGYGGNSQYLAYRIYYPKGKTGFFIGRNNPDNSYVFGQSVNHAAYENGAYWVSARWLAAFKANFYTGVESYWFITPQVVLGGGLLYNMIINPEYNPVETQPYFYRKNTVEHNFQFMLNIKVNF